MIAIKGWKTYSFKEIASLSKEKYNPKKETLNLPCIELEHIESETGRLLGHTNSLSQGSIKNRFKPGDVLYGKLRPYLKKYYFPDFEGVCSSEIWVLRNQKGKIRNKYLYYLVQTNRFNKSANISIGTKMPRADWDFVSETIFPIPTLKEQDKIISVLSTWDKAIELKEKLIEQKKELKKGLMQKLLTGEVRLPGFKGEWKEIKLGEFVKLQGGYAFKSSKFKQIGIPIIRISNIAPEITEHEQEFVYYEETTISENFHIKSGDILIAMSGATTGKVGIYKGKKIAYLNQRVGKFVNKDSSKLDYNFLYYLVLSPMFKVQLTEELATGAQPNISSRQIENFKFKIPSLEEQKSITSTLNKIDKTISLLKKEVYLLKQQKKGLMQLLLTGKVRVKV